MSPSLTEVFHASAKEACENFPQRLDRLFVFVEGQAAPVYISPDVAASLSRETHAIRNFIKRQTELMIERDWAGVACLSEQIAHERRLKTIGMRADTPGHYSDKYIPDMRAIYILDHELGHHIVPGGTSSHDNECRADAYAVLRHIQRFGLSTDFHKLVDKSRCIVLGMSPIHYTSAVFDAVFAHAKKNDVRSLSPAETAILAEKIAIATKMDSLELQRLAHTFKPAADAVIKRFGNKMTAVLALVDEKPAHKAFFCNQVASVMRANMDDVEVVRAGRRFLCHPSMKVFLEEKAKESSQWRDVLWLSKAPLPHATKTAHLNFKA